MTQPALSKMHELKTWPVAFEAVRSTAKTADFRKDDRPGGFQIGDLLKLREYDPQTKSYTGRRLTVGVTDVQRGPNWGIPAGYAVMSIRRVSCTGPGQACKEKHECERRDATGICRCEKCRTCPHYPCWED